MKDSRIYLAQILECVLRIQEFTNNGKNEFLVERMIQDAVIRNFEIMGEAVKRLPQDFRDKYPEIPWRMIAAFRDVLIHDYEGVDLIRVWKIIENELPKLKDTITSILPPLDQLEREINGESK